MTPGHQSGYNDESYLSRVVGLVALLARHRWMYGPFPPCVRWPWPSPRDVTNEQLIAESAAALNTDKRQP